MNKRPVIPLLIVTALLACSCGTTRHTAQTSERRIDVREYTEFVPVLVKIDIPELRIERTTRDSTSHLENEYATSDAAILPDGSLFHNLATKEREIKKEVQAPVFHKDSTATESIKEEVTIEKEVEKKLSWWQRIRLDGFWILLALVVWAYRKHFMSFGKKIWGLIKLIV